MVSEKGKLLVDRLYDTARCEVRKVEDGAAVLSQVVISNRGKQAGSGGCECLGEVWRGET